MTEQMLSNMFAGEPPGSYDRILDFSTAVTGVLFSVPSADVLDDPAAEVPISASTAGDAQADAAEISSDESLGIGSLRAGGPSS